MAEVNEVNVSRGGRMAEGDAAAKGGKLKLILIAVVLLIVLGGGAAVGLWLFLGHGKDGEMAKATGGGERSGGGGGIEGCPTEQLNYITLGDFVVNLSDGRRYLKTKIDLMLCDKKVPAVNAYLTARMAEIKDLVISELQTLSSEQLRDQKERELLRQRLLRRVESLLPNGEHDWVDPNPIKKVLITEFYLQ
jgi:flagellar FliL protein